MSASGPTLGPEHGDSTEQWASVRFGWDLVSRPWCDALTAAGLPVEIKGCQRWQSDGDGRLRGRFRVWSDAHARLCERGGAYLFVVYERTRRGSLENCFWRFVPAVRVTPVFEDYWQDYSHRPSKGDTALVSWRNVFPRQV